MNPRLRSSAFYAWMKSWRLNLVFSHLLYLVVAVLVLLALCIWNFKCVQWRVGLGSLTNTFVIMFNKSCNDNCAPVLGWQHFMFALCFSDKVVMKHVWKLFCIFKGAICKKSWFLCLNLIKNWPFRMAAIFHTLGLRPKKESTFLTNSTFKCCKAIDWLQSLSPSFR